MAESVRVGMIGMDTSHCGAFASIFHEKLPELNVRVVAAYPSFSPDLKSSFERVEGYRKELAQKHDVKMTDSIEAMLDMVDAVMILSVDGRRHLPELRAVAHTGKPVFVDKPFAASLADAREMVRLIRRYELPCWSSSSLRYDSGFAELVANPDKYGRIIGCDVHSPAHLEPTNPGLFWYGIHGVEILYTIMGPGCRSVSCTSTPEADVVIGAWSENRLGTLRGIRAGQPGYGATVLSEKQPVTSFTAKGDYYPALCREIATFFRTRKAPVPIEVTLEICAFIDAAMRSAAVDADDIPVELFPAGASGPA